MNSTRSPEPAWALPDRAGSLPDEPLPISVVIPSLNEARSIGFVLAPCMRIARQVVVVVGEPDDGTSDIAREHGARVIRDAGKGKGLALRQAIADVNEEVVVFIDADCSHDPYDIPRVAEPLLADEADLVIASRLVGGSDEFHGDFDKFLRLFGSGIITLGINLRFDTQVTDSQNGFRGLRTEFARQLVLRERITTIEQEMLIKSLRAGGRVMEVPSHEYERLCGESVIELRRVWASYVFSWLKGLAGR